MVYTLGEASKATGKSKATISKAIKNGRISAQKDETGTFRIQPSELHRVYPSTVSFDTIETPSPAHVARADEALIRELEAKLEAALGRLGDKDAVIADLREDRDKWRHQATALLPPPPKKWRWLFGR